MEFPKIFKKAPKNEPKEEPFQESPGEDAEENSGEGGKGAENQEKEKYFEKRSSQYIDYVKSLREKFRANRKKPGKDKRESLDNELKGFIEELEKSLNEFRELEEGNKQKGKNLVGWKLGWGEPESWSESVATEVRATVKSANDESFDENKSPILTAIIKIHVLIKEKDDLQKLLE
ncbi:MAG: hypothetical protein U5L10_04875 [Candidatus Moranbacteria bacterium]|nr:hypothetical protein [Candidatus Moranbacteria bacterium]